MATVQNAVDAIRERVSKLEESVFGTSGEPEAADEDAADTSEEKAEE